MLQASKIKLNWAQVVKNGDRFEGDFLDRQPHGNVVYVRNPSNDDISDDGEQVNWSAQSKNVQISANNCEIREIQRKIRACLAQRLHCRTVC